MQQKPTTGAREASHAKRRGRALGAAVTLLAWVATLPACVTTAQYRKLESEVAQLKRRAGPGGEARSGFADLAVEIEALRTEVAKLTGRIEEAEHRAGQALEEARAARLAAHGGTPGNVPEPSSADPIPEGSGTPEELAAYRAAYGAWRSDDTQACIDRFREFLQTHPSSDYADDAAFWMADCHFKQGDYRTAVLRFDDVAGRYPAGNKAPDALYRQGEALLRLGYEEAAAKAFERVVNEYPGSARAGEAKRQVELLQAG